MPGTTIIPPAYDDFHWEPPEDEAFTYDPDEAGELLDEAGYTVGDDGFRTMPNGDPIGTLRLFARSESPTSLDTMDFFKEWLGDLGIKAEVTAVESNKLTEHHPRGQLRRLRSGAGTSSPTRPRCSSYMTCDQLGGWSDSWYCNEEYDALYEQQQTEIDREARAEMVKQMQQMLYEDSPYLVTAYDAIGEAFRSDRFACLRAAARPRRRLADAVRRLQLPQHAPGGRGRRLWRRRSGDRGDRRPATDERRRAPALLIGIGVAAGRGRGRGWRRGDAPPAHRGDRE